MVSAADVGTQLERAAVEINLGLGGRPEATESIGSLGEDGSLPEIRATGEGVRVTIRRVDVRGVESQRAHPKLGKRGGAGGGTDAVNDASGEVGAAITFQDEPSGGRGAIADDAARAVRSAVERSSDQRGAIEIERAAEIEIHRGDQVHQAGRSIDLQGAFLDIDARALQAAVNHGLALQQERARTELGEISREDAATHRGGAADVDQAFGRGGRTGRVASNRRATRAGLERGGVDDEGITTSGDDRRAGRNTGARDEHAGDEPGGTARRQGDRGATRGGGKDAGERDRAARVEDHRGADGRRVVGEQATHTVGSGERTDAGDAEEGTVARGNVRVRPDRESRRARAQRLTEAEVGDRLGGRGADRCDRTRQIVRQDTVRGLARDEVRDAGAGDRDDRRDQDTVGVRRGDDRVDPGHADVGGREADAVGPGRTERETAGDVEDERAVGTRRAGHGQRSERQLVARKRA